jgi:hypothetical protein
MLKDIVEARPMRGYRLSLRFEDGVTGEVDVRRLIPFDGVFAPLRDPVEFARVAVAPDLGTVVWPNGADLDPDVLYAEATGSSIRLKRRSALDP